MDPTEARVVELEARAAWLEHRLAEVEEMVRVAFGRIEQLEVELKHVAERPSPEEAEQVGWEPPPHY